MNALTTTPETSVMEYTPADVHHQVQRIQHMMKEVMKEGDHYGLIPGCGPKPALLKAGAEKLCFAFRMAPRYDITLTPLTGGHREYQIVCELRHIVTNQLLGAGVGCCSTMESKYRYRGAKSEDEITETPVPRKYWDRKKATNPATPAELQGILAEAVGEPGKYGTKKVDDVWMITRKGESTGDKVENPDIADVFNTVLKMAKKRAHVDAVLTATAASDIFAQDIEENPEMYGGRPPDPRPDESREVKPNADKVAVEVSVVELYENDDKALAKAGWRGVEFNGGDIAETNDAALISTAKQHLGTGEILIALVEKVPGKEFPRLVSLSLKVFDK